MAASSVTGTGPGSCEGKDKGSKHESLGIERLIGPRNVYADVVTLDVAGDLVFDLDARLSGVAANYAVLTTVADPAASAVAADLSDVDGRVRVTLKGTADKAVNLLVVRRGSAI